MESLRGKFVFGGGQTWYRIDGPILASAPLVVLHGGPGFTSHYLENLAKLASDQRGVVIYDQTGCGRSSGGESPEHWTMDAFIEQFLGLLDHLGLERVDLLGHSWGGYLALEIAVRHPRRLRRLVLSSSGPSSQMVIAGASECVEQMDDVDQKAIKSGVSSGNFSTPEYRVANQRFVSTYCERLSPLPEALRKSNEAMNVGMYQHMWGPSEFVCNGTLADWDVSSRLGEISIPVLLTSGAFDEAAPSVQTYMVQRLPNARWKCFGLSAHQSHQGEEAEFLAEVEAFLAYP